MDRVWVRGKTSEKVIEYDEVHYFYWKVEVGLQHIEIQFKGRRWKIPVSLIKLHDYEPIKRVGVEVWSRYHHRFLAQFKQPKTMKGRPIAQFITTAHVPIVLSEGRKRVRAEVDEEELTLEESYALPIFLQLLKSHCWIEARDDELHDYEPIKRGVPEDVIFNQDLPHKLEVG